jgi:hypothetical protein
MNVEWAAYEERARRITALKEVDVRTPEQSRELDDLVNGQNVSFFRLFNDAARRWFAAKGRVLVLAVVITTSLAIMPLHAHFQASRVAAGSQDWASRYGLFAYRAEPVSVAAANDAAVKALRPYVSERLFLLGHDAQYVVLFSPRRAGTLRFPVASVVVGPD